jgi:hypothetical protein
MACPAKPNCDLSLSRRSVAAPIVGGMITSTVHVLILVPVLLCDHEGTSAGEMTSSNSLCSRNRVRARSSERPSCAGRSAGAMHTVKRGSICSAPAGRRRQEPSSPARLGIVCSVTIPQIPTFGAGRAA